MKKKFLKTIVTFILLATLCLGIFACGTNSFEVKEDFKSKKNLTATNQGGFALETEEFYYVINGVGDSTADNDFGEPLKGTLLAVKKDSLGKDKIESSIVVPKLFVASDYNAGIYIYDGYVYFATPSTDKELTGNVKNSYLTFARAKLDGSDYKEFETVSGLSSEYRFFKNNDKVFILYYDSEAQELVSYDTKDGVKLIIAKTSDEIQESLDSYKFFNDGRVAYTTTVYRGEYIKGTTRATESYNKLYIYTIGDSKVDEGNDNYGKLIKNGKGSAPYKKYSIKDIVNNYLVYTESYTNSTKTFIIVGEEEISINKEFDATFIYYDKIVLTLDTTYKKVITNDLETGEQAVFADGADVSKLLFKEGDYIYFVNASNRLARIKEGAMLVEYISEDSIASDWFKPVLLGDGIVYCDNSTAGASNVKYVELKNVKEEKDDAGEITSYYFEGHKFISNDFEKDEFVNKCDADIDSLSKTLDSNSRITEETKTKLKSIKDAYEKLSEEAKETIAECYAELDKYDDAISLSEISSQLKGIELEIAETSSDKQAIKTKYQQAYDKAVTAFAEIENKGNDHLKAVCNLMEGNTYYYFYYAKTYIFNS